MAVNKQTNNNKKKRRQNSLTNIRNVIMFFSYLPIVCTLGGMEKDDGGIKMFLAVLFFFS